MDRLARLWNRSKGITKCADDAKTRSVMPIAGGVSIGMLVAAHPAFAQITKVNTVMAAIQTTLTGVSVTVFTIALIWVGYKMIFDGARWTDVSNIVFGAILVGGATGIASFLMAA